MNDRPLKSCRVLWVILAIFYASILLTIMGLAYTRNLPAFLSQNDKLGHLVLYGIAAYLGHRALSYRQMRLGAFNLPLFPLLFTLFTVAEEGAQSFSPYRSLDPIDLIASLIGIGLGYWLAECGRRSDRN